MVNISEILKQVNQMRSAVIEQKCNIFGSMNFFYRVPSIPVYMNKNSITITLCSDNKNGRKKEGKENQN